MISLFADFIANEKPLLIKYENEFYFPILQSYSETTFGGDFETEADYRDPFVKNLINSSGWMIMPIIPIMRPSNEKKYNVANITG